MALVHRGRSSSRGESVVNEDPDELRNSVIGRERLEALDALLDNLQMG